MRIKIVRRKRDTIPKCWISDSPPRVASGTPVMGGDDDKIKAKIYVKLEEEGAGGKPLIRDTNELLEEAINKVDQAYSALETLDSFKSCRKTRI